MKTLDLLQTKLANSWSKDLEGFCEIFPLSDYISWIEMDFDTKKEITISLNDTDGLYLHFLYNLKDTLTLSSSGGAANKLENFQSAIIHDQKGRQTFLHLKGESTYQFCIVKLAKHNVNGDLNPFFVQFEEEFKKMSEVSYYLHTGLPNLELGEYVKKLMDMAKTQMSDKLMAAGYINILLSLKMKQFLKYIEDPSRLSALTVAELERIKQISDLISKAPEDNYLIEDICHTWGLSASKLQTGFKEMHGRTVCSFINHMRLLKAEELLKTTSMNVSEIVYALGWSSRSYFCKIFKEKYQCTPKGYQQQLLAC
ncbi:AraC family transcriptional regulator [Subsaxibacter sp. CAU 1640]|uniref:helix-turn-helix domain-containing protein n=1 Tax=Subsaxibacter sp. CAU 1640 TaxID=2933271 RepID=UPI002003E1AA|nr:AraC family transcriptional regulator [Subsaxibacter sp. CAU 1640]MCK7590624.1 AraC family transcriptional regulator [Subsaxibacter sp. CAU 1640]